MGETYKWTKSPSLPDQYEECTLEVPEGMIRVSTGSVELCGVLDEEYFIAISLNKKGGVGRTPIETAIARAWYCPVSNTWNNSTTNPRELLRYRHLIEDSEGMSEGLRKNAIGLFDVIEEGQFETWLKDTGGQP